MWRKSVQHILALPDLTYYWIDEAFPKEIKLIFVMTAIKKISMKNMKKVLYLKRSVMESELIVMLMTMIFYLDETLVQYF